MYSHKYTDAYQCKQTNINHINNGAQIHRNIHVIIWMYLQTQTHTDRHKHNTHMIQNEQTRQNTFI